MNPVIHAVHRFPATIQAEADAAKADAAEAVAICTAAAATLSAIAAEGVDSETALLMTAQAVIRMMAGSGPLSAPLAGMLTFVARRATGDHAFWFLEGNHKMAARMAAAAAVLPALQRELEGAVRRRAEDFMACERQYDQADAIRMAEREVSGIPETALATILAAAKTVALATAEAIRDGRTALTPTTTPTATP